MGFIPETVTRRLPSSLVGTLGVDTSGEQLGGKIAQAGATLFGQVTKQAAERKRTLDIISAQASIRQFESDMDGIVTVNKENFKGDPQGGVDNIFKDGETLIESTLAQIKDPSVKAMVAQGTTTALRGNSKNMRSWAHQQEAINAAVDLASISNSDAERLFQNPDPLFLAEAIGALHGRENLYKETYGTNWPNAMRESEKSIMLGMINGLEKDNPFEGDKFLKETNFGGLFNSSELEKLKANMESSLLGRKKTVAVDTFKDVLGTSKGMQDAYNEGKLTPAFVDARELAVEEKHGLTPQLQEVFADARKVAAEGTDLGARLSKNTFNNLNHKLRALKVNASKTDAVGKLSELFNFNAAVWKASADGKIDPNQRANFLNQTLTPILDDIQKGTGQHGNFWGEWTYGIVGNLDKPEDKAFDKVEDWVKDMNFSEETGFKVKAQILSEVYTVVRESRERGVEFTNEQVEALVESYFVKELATQNPALQHIPPEGRSYKNPLTGEMFTILPTGAKVRIVQ